MNQWLRYLPYNICKLLKDRDPLISLNAPYVNNEQMLTEISLIKLKDESQL